MPRMFNLVILVLLVGSIEPGCRNEPAIDGKTVSEWVDLLRHDDWAVQALAIDALARLGPAAVPYLTPSVRGKDPTSRRGAVIALGRIGAPAKTAVESLLRRMAREDIPVIRAEILKALQKIDPVAPKVMEEFKKRLRDQIPEVQETARQMLDASAPKPVASERGGATVKPPEDEALRLREAVAAELGQRMPGVSFGLVAEVVRESRRAAVVWPAIRDGKILDDDVVALVFGPRGRDSWAIVGEPVTLSQGEGSAKLVAVLGGADKQRVVHPCGVAREKLENHLKQWGCAFKQALAGGRAGEAVAAYEELGRAFSFPLVAFDDFLSEGLANGVFCDSPLRIDPDCTGDTCIFHVSVKGKDETGRMVLQSCGQGLVIAELKR